MTSERNRSAASIVNIGSPITAIGENTVACPVGDYTIAKRCVDESPSMKPTVTIDPVRIKTGVIDPLIATVQKAEILFGNER
jgi:hypothetical protein